MIPICLPIRALFYDKSGQIHITEHAPESTGLSVPDGKFHSGTPKFLLPREETNLELERTLPFAQIRDP